MAGIFGIWNVDGRPVERQLLGLMGQALAHRGPDGERLHIEGAFGLGCRLFRVTPEAASEAQPLHKPSGTSLVFDGRLDNRDELIAAMSDRYEVSTRSSDAELVAASYDVVGLDVAAHLLGDFSFALFDPRQRRLLLARDAIGIRPLYYCRTARSIIFGSEIKAILAHPDVTARPHDRLLAELLLRHLHRHDDDGTTFFDGIAGVPPAHVAVMTPERANVRRYWDFDGRPHSRGKSFDACAEEFRDHFERAVRRRLRSAYPVAISVSGGLDSSSVFCLADRLTPAASPRVVGLTHTTTDGTVADESSFIADIERWCGRAIEYIQPPPVVGLLDRAGELIRRVEAPMLATQWDRTDRFLAAVGDRGARVLLTGHWGDQILFDQAYLIDLLHRCSWRTIGAHLNEYPRWFPDAQGHDFTDQFIRDFVEHDLPHALRRMLRAVRKRWKRPEPWDDWYSERFRSTIGDDVFDHELSRSSSPTVLARALYREVRSRYHGLCLDWNNKMASVHGLETAFPFLDRDLVDFMMGVPGEVLARNGVPKAILRGALSGLVPDSILRRQGKGDFTAMVNESSRRDYAAIVNLLGRDALVVQYGYVDADKLKNGLAAAESMLAGSTSCAASWRITGVLALELWLQEFVGNRRKAQEDATSWTNPQTAAV